MLRTIHSRSMSLALGLGRHGAVAQHHGVIGDLQRLLEVVGDVDDRDAAGREVADDLEQHLDLGGAERRGRLVHDEDARVDRQRAGDLDDLLLAEAQVLDQGQRDRSPPRARPSAPRPAAPPRRSRCRSRPRSSRPMKMLSRTLRFGREAELLVDDRDAAVARVRRGREGDRLPVELDRCRRSASRRPTGSSSASTCRRRSRRTAS